MEETTQGAGAEPVTPSTETAGNQSTTTGAETLVQPTEVEGSGIEVTSQEPTTEAEGTGSKPVRVDLETRVQQLVEKRISEMETKFQQQQEQQQAARPTHATDEQINQLQGMITDAIFRENEILGEIGYESDPQKKNTLATELRQIRKWLPVAEDAIEKDTAERTKWQQAQQANAAQQQQVNTMNARMNAAQEMFRQEMRIPAEIWESAQQFFKAERNASPLVNQKFLNIWERSGEIAALEFARDYCEKNMGRRQEQATQQKEEAKNILPAGKTSTGAIVGNPELDALRLKATRSGLTEDIANYSAAKVKFRAAA